MGQPTDREYIEYVGGRCIFMVPVLKLSRGGRAATPKGWCAAWYRLYQ